MGNWVALSASEVERLFMPAHDWPSDGERVYLVRRGAYLKIGWTFQLGRRIRALSKTDPGTLELVGTLDGGRQLEAQLHEQFAEYRVRGEWFQLTGRLAAFINCESARMARQNGSAYWADPVQFALAWDLAAAAERGGVAKMLLHLLRERERDPDASMIDIDQRQPLVLTAEERS